MIFFLIFLPVLIIYGIITFLKSIAELIEVSSSSEGIIMNHLMMNEK